MFSCEICKNFKNTFGGGSWQIGTPPNVFDNG